MLPLKDLTTKDFRAFNDLEDAAYYQAIVSYTNGLLKEQSFKTTIITAVYGVPEILAKGFLQILAKGLFKRQKSSLDELWNCVQKNQQPINPKQFAQVRFFLDEQHNELKEKYSKLFCLVISKRLIYISGIPGSGATQIECFTI